MQNSGTNIPIEQYVFGPWFRNGKESKKPIDPELFFYFKSGMQPVKIIPNYFTDPESLNYGVLLFWPNFFKNNYPIKDEALSYLVDFFSWSDKTFETDKKRTITRWNLLLPGAGCSWAHVSGGCYMCGFKHATQMFNHNRLPSPSILKKLYTIGYDKIQRENPEMLTIYNGGSFLNDKEIPLEIQQWICEQVNIDKTIKTLFIESRAEFVNENRLNALTSILNRKKLVLGIGLECVTDSIREKCVNKGLSIEVYEQAVKM